MTLRIVNGWMNFSLVNRTIRLLIGYDWSSPVEVEKHHAWNQQPNAVGSLIVIFTSCTLHITFGWDSKDPKTPRRIPPSLVAVLLVCISSNINSDMSYCIPLLLPMASRCIPPLSKPWLIHHSLSSCANTGAPGGHTAGQPQTPRDKGRRGGCWDKPSTDAGVGWDR